MFGISRDKTLASHPPRLGDRILGFFGFRLVVFLIAAQAFLPGVLLDPPFQVAYYHDEHNVIMHEEAARKSWGDFHQLPAWEPYFCGGIIGMSNAPSNAMAPDFLLRVVYGTLVGRRLAVLLFVLLGMEGTFRLARRNGASAIGAAAGGVAFATSYYYVTLLTSGWIFMFHYDLVPWVVLGFEEGLRKKWWIVVGGFFMSWLLLGGGTYVIPYTALILALLLVYETARAVMKADGAESVKWYRPLLVLVAMAIVTAGLCAIRLFPLLDLLASHTRGVQQKDQNAPLSIIAMLAFPKSQATAGGAGAGDFYVGSWIVLLACFALITDKRSAKFWAIAAIFGAFAAGEFMKGAPYEYLRKLPLYSQLRFPVRMTIICALFLALAGAMGLTRYEDWVRRLLDESWQAVRVLGRVVVWFGSKKPWRELNPSDEASPARAASPLGWRVVAGLLATATAGHLAYKAASDVYETNHVERGLYNTVAPQIYAQPGDFKQARGNRWDAHVFTYANMGSLHCFEEHELFTSPYLRGDLAAEEYPAPNTDTQVERISWSPHEIVLRVKSSGEGRFLVNQNHNKSWKTDVGVLSSDGGLISVKVPPGEHVVTLRYSDWKIRVGALVSFATVLALAIAFFRRARTRVRAYARLWRMLPAGEGVFGLATAGAPSVALADAKTDDAKPVADDGTKSDDAKTDGAKSETTPDTKRDA